MSKQLTAAINSYIDANPTAFTYGSTFTWKQFRKQFSKFFPELSKANPRFTADSIKFVGAYNSLNRILAVHGLYMKASHYYTKFTILSSSKEIDKRLKSYMSHIDVLSNRRVALYKGNANRVAGIPYSFSDVNRIDTNPVDRSCLTANYN